MRLAIISDVHGNLVALEAVLADIASRAPDTIVNLGDCVTGPLWPRETLELLESLDIATVRGNHDRWLVEEPPALSPSISFTRDALTAQQRHGLAALPTYIELDHDVLAIHGTPESDTEYLLEEAIDGRLALVTAETLDLRLRRRSAGLILCGHSHHQHTAFAPGDRLIVNPGSVGCPRSADNNGPLVAEAGSTHARYAVATMRKGGWTVELIALDYAWGDVADQALRNGRPDWVVGFLGHAG